jgi:beta-lactamase regulating signal transducer with metallopeptidase domain
MLTAATGFLAEHGATLLAGTTALLAAGAVGAAAARRSPVHRQRISELAVGAALAWLVLACVPMRRVDWGGVARVEKNAVAPAALDVTEIPTELFAAGSREEEPAPALRPSLGQAVRPPTAGGTSQAIRDGTVSRLGNRATASDATVTLPGPIAQFYLVGGTIAVGWLVLGHVLLWRLTRRAAVAPGFLIEMIDGRLRAGRRVRVLVSDRVAGPFTWGAVRPTILLPAGLLAEDCRPLLRQVLLHEVGHVRQGDGWGNLLFNLALPVLYVHPLYWLLRRAAGASRELVADDWAARADGKDAYVSELITLARSVATRTRIGPIGAIGMLQGTSNFYRRMRMLLLRPNPLATRCSNRCRAAMAALTLGAVVGASSLGGARTARAQQPAASPTPAVKAGAEESAREVKELRAQRDALVAEMAALRAQLADTLKTSKPGASPTFAAEAGAAKTAGEGSVPGLPGAPGSGGLPRPQDPRGVRPAMTPPAVPGVATPAAVRGVQLDLVNLANTLVDAGGALRLAKVQYENAVRAEKLGTPGAGDRPTAEAMLVTAEKRFSLLRSIAEVALESAEEDARRAKQLAEQGMMSSQEFQEAAGKAKMLKLILRGAD